MLIVMTSRPPGSRAGAKNDPLRRQRIIDATARLIAERGIDAVTFRGVAAAAGIPLGSTTYYFESKDELLLATIRYLRAQSTEQFQSVLDRQIPELGLARGVAALLAEVTGPWRDTLLIGYGAYLSMLGQEQLRDEVVHWQQESQELMRRYADPETARVLFYLIEGMLGEAVFGGRSFDIEDAEPVLRRALNEK